MTNIYLQTDSANEVTADGCPFGKQPGAEGCDLDKSQTDFESKEKQFWDAARAGDLSLVKTLAADPTLNVNWQGQLGFTTLNVACELGRVSVVQFLLTLTTVDVNKPTNDEATPFFIACQKGHTEVATLLLAGTAAWNNKTAAEHARYQGTRVKMEGESDEEYTRRMQNGP